ncbi:unnamed protein product [Aureobasidium mustum]|uniref:Multicopper oxidase n=1 Tax=Aureobasidium mustum TaxID=2773714 RepID=A0A9N8K183_9PEZI|nr:unnamed protein product [Aureobasidium mustum]
MSLSREEVARRVSERKATNIDRRTCHRVVPMEVLNLAIRQALFELGYFDVYHMASPLEENRPDANMWVEAFDAKYEGKGKFTREDWDQLLGHCMAVTDYPASAFAPELIAAYPEAKVVLSLRDNADVWHKSYMPSFVKMGKQLYKYAYEDDFPRTGKQVYEDHIEELRRLVPPENLLEYNVKQGWAPLCEFLGKPIPDHPFPRVNDTKEFLSKMEQRTAKVKGVLRMVSSVASLLAISRAAPHGHAEAPNVWHWRNSSNTFSIETDYYNEAPVTGRTVTISNGTVSPDGVERSALLVNGVTPGPVIRANWGDWIVVHVQNNLKDQGTGIHFHGIRQNQTNPMDGVASITECPIAPGDSFVYKWRATQYGTSWYHSHYSLQQWDGVYGGIIIDGPSSMESDVDAGMVFLTDWGHQTVSSLLSKAESSPEPVKLENGLINGLNTHDFFVLASVSTANYTVGDVANFVTTNPPRRDTIMLPASGYIALAFKTDNPGMRTS